MRQVVWTLSILTLLLVLPEAWTDAEANEKIIQDLSLRIEELEKQFQESLTQIPNHRPQVNSFFSDDLILGGFFEPSYTMIAGPDTELQAGSHSHLLGLNLSAQYTNKIRFSSQLLSGLAIPLNNEHNDPRASRKRREYDSFIFGAIIAQGYVEFTISPQLRVQTGLGYVPFGHYAQLREPVLFVRRGGPQLLRTANLFTPLWMGVNLVGTYLDQKAGYNIYTAPSVDQSQKPGIGARVWRSSSDGGTTFGLSAQTGKNGADVYEVLGGDFKMTKGSFKLITEYVTQMARGENPWSVSLSPRVAIYEEEILLYCFTDYSSATQNKTGSGALALDDPYQKWEYGVGINWLPTTFTRYRVGVTFNDYVGGRDILNGQNRDYTSLDLSVGVTF